MANTHPVSYRGFALLAVTRVTMTGVPHERVHASNGEYRFDELTFDGAKELIDAYWQDRADGVIDAYAQLVDDDYCGTFGTEF